MTSAVLQFVLAATVIVVAGIFLTRAADAIAELTGLGRLLVGSILLAGATSLPELSVDISAVRLGEADLAVGDLMGSSLFNLLILGILDLSHRSKVRMLSRASAAHALSATLSIALTAVASMSILLGTRFPMSVAGLGLGSICLMLIYLLGVRMVFVDQRLSAALVEEAHKTPVPNRGTELIRSCVTFALAALVIVFSAPRLAEAAATIADLTGLGGTFIGTTLVALSTSLPELVASLASLRMGAFDMAIGNIFGSNAFNMILLVVLDAVQPGSLYATLSPTHVLTGMTTILVTATAILGQLYRVEKRILLMEPDGALVVLLILSALALVYYTG